jgi:hypothetical protein
MGFVLGRLVVKLVGWIRVGSRLVGFVKMI